MKTISDILKIIQEDKEIQNLIIKSEVLNVKYNVPIRRTAKTSKSKAGVMRDYFWKSIEAIELKEILENKYGIKSSSNTMIGKVKDALLLYFSKYKEEK